MKTILALCSLLSLPGWAGGQTGMPSALFILTSDKHGYWGEELSAPVEALRRHSIRVDFASPAGKAVIDPVSAPDPDALKPDDPLFQWTAPGTARKVIALEKELSASGTLRLEQVRGGDYNAVVVVGGHGSIFDVNQNPQVHRILQEAASAGRIVAAECHGTGALAFANLIAGKRVTGFPDAWEPAALRPELPYILQEVLDRASGGNYEDGLALGTAPKPHVIVQGKLITSRDPLSSEAMGAALLEALGVR